MISDEGPKFLSRFFTASDDSGRWLYKGARTLRSEGRAIREGRWARIQWRRPRRSVEIGWSATELPGGRTARFCCGRVKGMLLTYGSRAPLRQSPVLVRTAERGRATAEWGQSVSATRRRMSEMPIWARLVAAGPTVGFHFFLYIFSFHLNSNFKFNLLVILPQIKSIIWTY